MKTGPGRIGTDAEQRTDVSEPTGRHHGIDHRMRGDITVGIAVEPAKSAGLILRPPHARQPKLPIRTGIREPMGVKPLPHADPGCHAFAHAPHFLRDAFFFSLAALASASMRFSVSLAASLGALV